MSPVAQTSLQNLRLAVVGASIYVAVTVSGCDTAGSPQGGDSRSSSGVTFASGSRNGNRTHVSHYPDSLSGPAFRLAETLRARVMQDGKWGLIRPDGHWVAEPEYDQLLPFTEQLAAAQRDGRLGYLDTAGQFAIEPGFQSPGSEYSEAYSALSFQRGLAVAFNPQGKCGYINRAGRFQIQACYDYAWPFMANGLAFVKKGSKIGLIDTTGRVVVQPMIESLNPERTTLFSEGLEPVFVNGKWGYLNRTGQFAIPPNFRAAGTFSSGRARVETAQGVGYINRRGEMLTWIDFEDGRDFAENRAAVRVGDEWCYIDTSGRVVIFPRYQAAFNFRDSLALVQAEDGNWGLLGPDGGFRLPPRFEEIIYPVPPGDPIPVRLDGKWGFADRQGRLLLRPQFHAVRKFAGGFAAVHQEWKGWGFINRQGKLSTPLSFTEVGDFSQGAAPAKAGEKWGYIDSLGRWIIPPQFEFAQPFEGGE